MRTEPTPTDLREAYARTRLWMQGVSIDRAMGNPLIRACLRGIAINQRRLAERNGQPVPQQAALI